MTRTPRRGRPRLDPGTRLATAAMAALPSFSIARMDDATLNRIQRTALPARGPVTWVLGGTRRGVTVETTTCPGPGGDVPLRVYTPTAESARGGRRPLVLGVHGGGFALGSARLNDWSNSIVADEVGAVVVAPDYRLAPTHRFPAAVEDCWAALRWAADRAPSLGADPDRIGVMGDSAGGNLAAVLALAARDEGLQIRHQALIYPATDLTESLQRDASYEQNDHGLVISLADLEVFRTHYLGEDDPVASSDTAGIDWRASPVHAPDLTGLPPTVVVLAGLDPLHDSGVRYAEALAAAGVAVRVHDFHRAPHGFLGFPTLSRAARPAMEAVVASQRAVLTGED